MSGWEILSYKIIVSRLGGELLRYIRETVVSNTVRQLKNRNRGHLSQKSNIFFIDGRTA